MRAIIVFGAAALALAGCQSPEEKRAAETGQIEVANASADEVSRLMRAAQPKLAMKPGEWRFELRVLSAETGAGPLAEGDAKLASLRQQERTIVGCRAEKDLKPIDLEQLEKVAGECTFPRYSLARGKLEAQIECEQPSGAATRMTARGTTSSDGFAVTLDQRSGTPGAEDYVALKLQARGRRLGECRG